MISKARKVIVVSVDIGRLILFIIVLWLYVFSTYYVIEEKDHVAGCYRESVYKHRLYTRDKQT